MEKTRDLTKKVELPEGVSASFANGMLKLTGKRGEVSRKLGHPSVNILVEGNAVVVAPEKNTQKEKKLVGTFVAHTKNMMKGVVEGHVYELKVCSGHFPMNVAVQGKEFTVKNLFGEKVPRKVSIRENTSVKVEGAQIIVESVDKELAGQMAADIESLTRVRGKDRRIFQDGIFIVKKDGKVLS